MKIFPVAIDSGVLYVGVRSRIDDKLVLNLEVGDIMNKRKTERCRVPDIALGFKLWSNAAALLEGNAFKSDSPGESHTSGR
jgi:hypothetical protein